MRHLAGFMKDDVRDPLEGAGVPDGYLRRGQFVADNLALLPYELQREVLLALKECELQLTPVAQRSLKVREKQCVRWHAYNTTDLLPSDIAGNAEYTQ